MTEMLDIKNPQQIQDSEEKTTLIHKIPTRQRQMTSKEWTICCSHTNKHALKYLIQVTMGSCVMIFCMIMIVLDEEAEDKSIYYSLLSGTLGYFLPHPSLDGHP